MVPLVQFLVPLGLITRRGRGAEGKYLFVLGGDNISASASLFISRR